MKNFKNSYFHADDYGLHPSITSAVSKLIDGDFVDGVSVVVNGADFASARDYLLLSNKKITCGIHINLVEGVFLTTSKISTFTPLKILVLSFFKLLDTDILEQEIEAQIEALLESGLEIDYLDSHQHIHFIPAISEIIVKACLKYKINKVRLINEKTKGGAILRIVHLIILNFLSLKLKKKLQSCGLKFIEFNYGFLFAGSPSEAQLEKTYQECGLLTAYFHPGESDSELGLVYPKDSGSWERDYNILKNLDK